MRKRWLILILCTGVLAVIVYVAYQFYERERLFLNCYSDKLMPIAGRLDRFSSRHHRLADDKELFENLSNKSHEWITTCVGSHQLFVWNDRIREIPVGSTKKVPLVWCPPDSHGRYVGVVVLASGAVKANIMTRAELNNLLALSRTDQAAERR